MNAPDFHVHSTFSTLDGMGTPYAVVEQAKKLGWGAVSLTEHGWMGSAPILYKAARENGLKPILGCEFYIVPEDILGVKSKDTRSGSFHLTVLALSAEGYHNLVAWTTFAAQPENFYYNPRISLQMMAEVAPYPLHHNVVLSGCLGSEICSGLASLNGHSVNPAPFVSYIAAMKSLFPNFFMEVQNHRHEKFMGKENLAYEQLVKTEKKVRNRLLTLARQTNTPVILTNDSHFQTTEQRRAHLLMTAQKRGKATGKIDPVSYLPEYGYFTNYMQSMEKIAERTVGLPSDTLENALAIVEESNIVLDPLDNFSYSIPFSGYDDPIAKIRKRCAKPLARAVKKHGKAAEERFEHELKTMGDFAHYLLIMSDLIRYARKQGILTNTRGSAANSFLCHLLGIHVYDSIEYGLLFSRFMNPARPSLPDIDIDIQKGRFEDFMKYVKSYMAEREGEGNVVQICNYGTLANRSTFRMIAQALGMPKDEADEIAKLLPALIDSGMVDEDNDVYEALKEDYPDIYEMATKVFDSIKNISQHACGWLFGTKDRPISQWVPLTLIASSGSLVTQYNMKTLEDMGLNKGDFLRLRTLDVIQNTRKLLGQDALDITDIPLDDPATFEMLREGRTEGVFTLQGKENRKGCIEVEVGNVHDVIRTVAIYRPALTRENKHTLYNNRRKGIEPVQYAHEIAEKALGDTYGIPIFQEQVMELCYLVGMSDEEVYEVYKAIKLAKGQGRGAKEAFAKIKPKFYARAKEGGHVREIRDALWAEVVGSQGYGFNKGHATSYGVLAVRAAFLKANHPAEFFTALLDVYPEKAKYVAAARAEGFHFAPPSVNDSGGGFTLDRASGQIRVGLRKVAGLGPVAVSEILAGQPFSGLDDFKERTSRRALNKTRMETLASVGALECLGVKKTANDEQEYQILDFTLRKPKILRKVKPHHVNPRVSDRGWKHYGLEKGAEITEYGSSVSKLFWIPDIPDSKHHRAIELKASPWAQVKTFLLLAIDVNGLPFHIMAQEDKEAESKILQALARHFRGGVVCLDGALRQPFLTDGPMGFRFYGISGADFNNDPQVWMNGELLKDYDKRKAVGLIGLHEQKRRSRRNAA